MNLFDHTTAEYGCSKHCGNSVALKGVSLSPFFGVLVLIASVSWILLLQRFTWKFLLSIPVVEFVLLFLVGFVLTVLWMPIEAFMTSRCGKCGAPMFLAGRHFDPAGSKRPHWTDIVISILFLAVNVTLGFCLLKSTG